MQQAQKVTRVVFLSGAPRVGKDEVAKYLHEKHGFNKIAFADGVRDFLLALDPMIPNCIGQPGNIALGYHDWPSADTTLEVGAWNLIPLSVAVERHGWDALKEDIRTGVRRLMQRMGTEVGRQMLGEHFWVNWAEKKPLQEHEGEFRVVVPDWRFPNESGFSPGNHPRLRTYWFIERPGYEPINQHTSETHYPYLRSMAEHIIVNDCEVSRLHEKIEFALIKDLSRVCRSVC